MYLFIRTNKLAKADVVKALQEGRSVLANSYGQLKGVATNREVRFPHTVLVLRKESNPSTETRVKFSITLVSYYKVIPG